MRTLKTPILVISSRAGLGNYTVGEVLSLGSKAAHVPVESLLDEALIRSDFARHRLLCERAPWVLALLHHIPAFYLVKRLKQHWSFDRRLLPMEKKIAELAPQTIIATNHRAALWVGALKRHRRLDVHLTGFLSDFSFTPGWRHVLWNEIDHLYGAVDPSSIPSFARTKYEKTEYPVLPDYHTLRGSSGDKNQVLITGGGWGLGDLAGTAEALVRAVSGITLHLACGDNRSLHEHLTGRHAGNKAIRIYGALPSLAPLMQHCASVVTKPGAATIAEAHAAGRQLFLIKGLPGNEEENRKHAIREMQADDFSIVKFRNWYESRAGKAA